MEENKRCPVFVDGKECGRELTEVEVEAKKLARYDLVTYKYSLAHRSNFVLEPKPSSDSREEREKRMDELTRKYVEIRDPEIREELYRLGRELEKGTALL